MHVPLGDYMYRVYTSERILRGEKLIYRLIGADSKSEQTLGRLRPQRAGILSRKHPVAVHPPAHPGQAAPSPNDPATPMTPALAWNTAVSFVTNTNWQAYSANATQGHLVQMAGLAVQNFVSAAVGMAVAMALVRGSGRAQHR